MNEVPFADLDVPDWCLEVFPPSPARWRGELFTGMAFDHETRCEYRDGSPHGACRTTRPDGTLVGEARYADGTPIGESRYWWPDGTLHTVKRYDDRGKLVWQHQFDATGQLRYEYTNTDDGPSQRTWYADGGLRSDRRDGIRWAYTRDGRCAFGEGVQTLTQRKVHDHFVFHEEVLADAMSELLDEFEFERGVWMWFHPRLERGDPDVVRDLRAILQHPDLGARATAIQVIGSCGLRALAPDLRAFLGDSRVPPFRYGEYPGQGGRGHSFSLGQTAALALEKLEHP